MIRQKCLKRGFSNLYETLRVNQNASAQQIKRSFNQLAKKYHPDVAATPEHNDQFVKIKAAYDTLRDEHKRKQYDHELVHGSPSTRKRYSYYQPTGDEYKSTSVSISDMIKCMALVGVVYYFYSQQPMTQLEMRRQNVLIKNHNMTDLPYVQDNRRKMYEQEIKEKKLTSRIVTIKTSSGAKQSEKSKNTRVNTIQSIAGIRKQTWGVEVPVVNQIDYI